MNKRIIGIIILVIAVILLIGGVIITYTKSNVITEKSKESKQTISEELYNKVKERMGIEDDSLKYVKTEEKKYFFNKVDQDDKVVAVIIYDAEKDYISIADSNEISEGTVEPGAGDTGPIDPNDKVN